MRAPVPCTQLHGHYLHICSQFCTGRRDVLFPSLDIHVRIERVGGGAAPEGFAAFQWPDELVRQQLTYWCFGYWNHVEDWTEDACLKRAIVALEDHEETPSWLPRLSAESLRQFAALFAEPWQRYALTHDVEDACLAIDSGFWLS